MVILAYLITAAVGAAVGWFVTHKKSDYGLGSTGNMVVGAVGALVLGQILPRVGLYFGSGIIGVVLNSVIYAVIGAAIALFILNFVKRS